jgi:hypothetical protein
MQRVAPVLLALVVTACSDPPGSGAAGRTATDASRTRAVDAPEAAAPALLVDPTSPARAPTGQDASASATARAPSAECQTARDARASERARIAALRLTLGVEPARRFDAATAAQQGCLSDAGCAQDGKRLVELFEAVQAAEEALGAEQRRLAEEELGLYSADQSVQAACGAE